MQDPQLFYNAFHQYQRTVSDFLDNLAKKYVICKIHQVLLMICTDSEKKIWKQRVWIDQDIEKYFKDITEVR